MPKAKSMLEGVGDVSYNVGHAFRYIWLNRVNLSHVATQIAAIGFDSLPIALIINIIAGCVLALHTSEQFAMTGASEYVGGLVAIAMVREMGPIFSAMAVGARAGTAISAEISNMAVSNQLDALQMMRINPIRYLMVPRLLACIVCLPMLTIIGEFCGIIGGMFTAHHTAYIHPSQYLDSVWLLLRPYDIRASILKSAIFGVLVAGISVTTGMNTRGGAKQVGLSTTQATVWTAIAIIIADFFLTWMLFGTRIELQR